MSDKPAPRGIRDNNPGNLVHVAAFRWAGELSPDGRYCRFDCAHNGLRAFAKNLWAYWNRDRCKTIRQIVNRHAPPIENDSEAYADDVSIRVAIHADDPLPLTDPEIVADLMAAMIEHENGEQPFSRVQIFAAIYDAGNWPRPNAVA